MTNGDFAFFTFYYRRTYTTDNLWLQYKSFVDDLDDLPRRQRALYVVKQVLAHMYIRQSQLYVKSLCLVHTADTDKTRLSRLVGVGGVN